MHIDIGSSPPLLRDIEHARARYNMGEQSSWYGPLSGLTLAGSLRISLMEGISDREGLLGVRGALDLDWSNHPAAQAYVHHVRDMDRPLLLAEIRALKAGMSGMPGS